GADTVHIGLCAVLLPPLLLLPRRGGARGAGHPDAGPEGGRDRGDAAGHVRRPDAGHQAGTVGAAGRRVLFGGGRRADRLAALGRWRCALGQRAQPRAPAVPAGRRGHRGELPGGQGGAGAGTHHTGGAVAVRAHRARLGVRGAGRRGVRPRWTVPGLPGHAGPSADRAARPRRGPDGQAARREHGAPGVGAMTKPLTYLAVDGGNSKTDVVVGDSEGRVLGFVRGPGSSPHLLGVPGSIALLDSLVRQLLGVAGLPAGTVLDRAEVYIAGADLPIEVDILTKAVGDAGWAQAHRVDNDLFALLRAGTSTPDAVAVVCGAGINCVGRSADGRTARFPSLGTISGDWGGGHHLAELARWQDRKSVV